ncbi:MAG: hypothetical protein FJ304_22025 [Planctomycetes bacterium]|nr:hypothetical protein [Planctomycetota bacterium]
MTRLLLVSAALCLAPVARATEPAPYAYTPEALARMSTSELRAVFASSPAGAAPVGFAPGVALQNPGSRRTAATARAAGLVWKGKEFRSDGTLVNHLIAGAKALPADVYTAPSRFDGQPALVFDYSKSKLWPRVRDEVREVSPGVYLGIMYKNGAELNPPMFFTLDARR